MRYDVQCFAQREMRVVRFDAERVENKRINAFKAVNGTLRDGFCVGDICERFTEFVAYNG